MRKLYYIFNRENSSYSGMLRHPDGRSHPQYNGCSHRNPMQEEHYIQFIILETKNGYQKKDLKPGDKPEAVFLLADGDEPVAVYENCNLHGLWKATL